MKVLIVDDEQHAREAIKLLVPWDTFGIEHIREADNGEEAKRLITLETPDLVLTDMHMPITDGVALLEWMARHAPDLKRIVVSGYNDFDYVRHTLKHGGQDYLLKPLDQNELIEAVRKAVEAIKKEEVERQALSQQSIDINQFKPVYWDKLFSRLLTEPAVIGSQQIQLQLQQEFNCPPRGTSCCAAVCSLDAVPPVLLRKFRGDRELLAFTVSNIVNDYVRGQWKCGYAFQHWSRNHSIVLLIWDGLPQLRTRLQVLSRAISSTLKAELHLGIGGEAAFPDGLGRSMEEARAALNQRNLLTGYPLVHSFRDLLPGQASFPHLTGIEEPCRLALVSRNMRELESVGKQWMEEMRRMPVISPEHVETWHSEFRAILPRWQPTAASSAAELNEEPNEEQKFPIRYDEHGKISLERTEEQLLALLSKLAAGWGEQQRGERNVVEEIKAYINHHFDQDVSLTQLAARFFLSREYVSRRFKQDTGQTLSEYVERLRIDKAKLLLHNDALRISAISEMVGYADEKYFCKVFKKQTGYSPNQYRKQEQH